MRFKKGENSTKSGLTIPEQDQISLHNLIFKHINKIAREATKSTDVYFQNNSARDIQRLLNMLKISLGREVNLYPSSSESPFNPDSDLPF